jgi:hypothetical protein
MILIIAEPTDVAAHWLRPRLSARLSLPVAIVTPTQLVCSRHMSHRLSTRSTSSRFILANGAAVESSALAAVVNRLGALPTDHLARASPRERTYARDELYAFLLGWLASLECPVVNRPEPSFLGGPWYPPREALQMAALAGLPCSAQRLTVDMVEPTSGEAQHSWFVVDGQTVGPLLPATLRDGLLRFAALWGGRIVQVDFMSSAGELEFVAGSSLVNYPVGGDLLVRALARALRP